MKLGMALIATMSAFVLSLLITSSNNSYDAQNTELTDLSTKVVLLNRVLVHYRPETKEMRELLRADLVLGLGRLWSNNRGMTSDRTPEEVLFEKIQMLSRRIIVNAR